MGLSLSAGDGLALLALLVFLVLLPRGVDVFEEALPTELERLEVGVDLPPLGFVGFATGAGIGTGTGTGKTGLGGGA